MNKLPKNFLLFLFFFTITFLLYFPTVHSKFVFDFVDLVFDYKRDGFASLFEGTHGISGNIVSRFILYALLKLIGLNEWLWFCIAIALHALNALLLYLFAKKILCLYNHPQFFLVSFLGALVFLISPYQTEVIVWGGAFNYLLVSCFVLIHLNAVSSFINSFSNRILILCLISFIFSVFSHEWGLFLLPIDILLWLLLPNNRTRTITKKNLILPGFLIGVTSIYFYNQFLHGQLIGHYGSETHLRFKLNELVPAFYKYILKISLLSAFFPANILSSVYSFLEKSFILYLLVLLPLLLAIVFKFLYHRNKKRIAPFVLFFLVFILFVFPVLNLYFPYWIKIQGDRYCYLPGAFLGLSFISVIMWRKSLLATSVIVTYAIVSLIFLYQNINHWHKAGEMTTILEQKFPEDSTKNYFLLNVPDNYNGAYMFRNLGKSCFAQTLRMETGVNRNERMTDVQSYNLQSENDSVFVSIIDSNSIRVELSHWGNWWWRTKNFENDVLKVREDDSGHSYLVTFKRKTKNDIFLYQAGMEWHQVKNF